MTQTEPLTARADIDAQIPVSTSGQYFMDGKLKGVDVFGRVGPTDDREKIISAVLQLGKHYESVTVNGTPIQPKTRTVVVPVVVDVDMELWAQGYGCLPGTQAILDDIDNHVAQTVLYHAKNGLDALGVGATVRD